ncbi:MAG TPA: glycosyltransferase [Longimicrobiales bacterium]
MHDHPTPTWSGPWTGDPGSSRTAVLIPVYEDWAAVARLIGVLDGVLAGSGDSAAVFLVDDGSTVEPGELLGDTRLEAIESVSVIRLRRNLGHQRAICIGLAYLAANHSYAEVVVMDGDGEDDPRDVPRLLECLRGDPREPVVFAERTRRSEGVAFTLGYTLYRILHRILTGRRIRVGNFSVVPRRRLHSIVTVPELWNHYAAAVLVSRQPHRLVPTSRARRLAGEGRMSYTALVVHGLSAISVYSDVVGTRLLAGAGIVFALALLALVAVLSIRLGTDLAIPGWATYSAGMLLLVLLQTISFGLLFTFLVLGNRKGAMVIPARDFTHFIDAVEPIRPAAASTRV